MLQVSDLTVHYGQTQALQSISRKFDAQKIYAITGPNGSGKSTFLKSVAGLIHPTSGTIHLDGIEITGRITPWVGIVLQRPVLFSGTVYHNVEFGLKCQGIGRMDRIERVNEILNRFDVANLAHKNRRCLSGGEIQRIALARTMILCPKVLALDEPFSHLDSQSVDQLTQILRSIRDQTDTTILLSTHDTLKGFGLADQIIAVSHGRLVEPLALNIIQGMSMIEDGTGLLVVNDHLRIEHMEQISGQAVFQIDPAAITLARERHVSSARNQLPGIIRSITMGNLHIQVMVDIGIPLVMVITPQSYRELQFQVGDAVWTSFKATAVKRFPTHPGS